MEGSSDRVFDACSLGYTASSLGLPSNVVMFRNLLAIFYLHTASTLPTPALTISFLSLARPRFLANLDLLHRAACFLRASVTYRTTQHMVEGFL